MEELVRLTVLLRPRAELLVYHYFEQVERDQPVETLADRAGIASV